MKNRLEIAKTLLADDGVIFIQHLDNNEYSYLNVLLNDIYSRNNHMNTIIWKKVKSAKNKAHFYLMWLNIYISLF